MRPLVNWPPNSRQAVWRGGRVGDGEGLKRGQVGMSVRTQKYTRMKQPSLGSLSKRLQDSTMQQPRVRSYPFCRLLVFSPVFALFLRPILLTHKYSVQNA